jgi:hypothetical protein
MLGRRFYDETGGQFISNNYNSVDPYVQGSYLNAKNFKYSPIISSMPRSPGSATDTMAAV